MKIYLDMDGVIADFFSAIARKNEVKHWKDIPDIEKTIKEMAVNSDDFFNTIPKFPTTDELVNFVRYEMDCEYGICSTPLRGDRENSAKWKRVWLKRHGLLPDDKALTIFTTNKPKYATSLGVPNVLVDDKKKNIKAWEEAGGIGIVYQANENSLESLKSELWRAKDEFDFHDSIFDN
jgi:hypothetical protein